VPAEKFLKLVRRFTLSQDSQHQNDIDQILKEVEELRNELNSETQSVNTQVVSEAIAAALKNPTDSPVQASTDASALKPTLAQATEIANELAGELAKELASITQSTTQSSTETAPSSPAVSEVSSAVTTIPETISAPTTAMAEDTGAADPETISDDLMKEFHASLESDGSHSESESMESTLAELREDPTVRTLLDQTLDDQARRQTDRENFSATSEAPAEPVVKEPAVMKKVETLPNIESSREQNDHQDSASPSLTMSLTGSMTLRLKYEFAGQEVIVGFTDEFLKVELADGTEFKIPVGRQKTLRRVA
jgi:hypothetical protein